MSEVKKSRSAAASKPPPRESGREAPVSGWVWGAHAGLAALANPERKIERVLASRNAARDLPADTKRLEVVDPKDIDRALPPGAVHQGLAVFCRPLDSAPLHDFVNRNAGVLVVLDQVTDPHNAGAVFRSAAAFGAAGVILQDRKAPPLMGACAKAAVGAVERVPHARVVNISRALGELRDKNWRVVGLTGGAETTLSDAVARTDKLALVVGAEDKGLRPGVAAACDVLARIPIDAAVDSLNVSNAAAIALYEAARARCGH